MKFTFIRLGLLAVMISALAGCGGATDGAPGVAGVPGTNGGTLVAVSNLTAAEWAALTPTIDPASISITIASPPVVKFKVNDANGNPLVGLATKTGTNLNNAYFTLAKLVPVTGGPSVWRSYLVTKPSTSTTTGAVADSNGAYWLGTYPTQEREGTMVDNGDGTYTYTFARDIKQAATIVAALTDDSTHVKADLGNVSYDPSATTRLAIVIKGNQPGSNPAVAMAYPANVTKDFRPDGGALSTTRDIVQRSSCDGCHAGKIIGHGDRRDPKLCVTCHTDQTKYGFANVIEGTNLDGSPTLTTPYYRTTTGEAAFTYPRMIHKFHMGEDLVITGYNLNKHCNLVGYPGYDATKPDANLAACFNTVGFPQSQTNCTKCHDGSATKSDGSVNVNQTKDGDNWMKVPNRLACGACHDGIDFATGNGITLADKAADVAAGNPVGTTQSGHGNSTSGPIGPQTGDSLCSGCHTPTQIQFAHRYTVPTLNNPVVQTGVSTITYDLKSLNVVAGQPVIVFRINKDGAPVTTLNAPAPADSSSTFQLITGLTRGPSIYVAYAVPQDGIVNPADFNGRVGGALYNLLLTSGGSKSGTVTGPDGSGYFTATLTGTPAAPITIPAGAKMVTGMIVGRFEQVVNAATVKIKPVLKTIVATGYTGRRVIVAKAKCDSCHEQLGTNPEFHNGERNDPTACAICHTPNEINDGKQTINYGWAGATNTYIHGIHAATKRSVPFTWAAWDFTETDNVSMIEYPGVLKNCEQCHLPGTVNFANTGGSTITPLYTTASAGTSTGVATAGPGGTDNSWAISPYINPALNYGLPPTIGASGVIDTTIDNSNNLVNSPIASACFSCHDTSLAKAHITSNGGAIYETRSTALLKTETCLICHGAGRVADVAVIHQ